MTKFRLPLVAFISGAGVLSFLGFSQATDRSDMSTMFRYQFLCLGVSAIAMLAIKVVTKQDFEFLRFGTLHAQASEIRILGVKSGESWTRVGITFALVVSIVTATFMYVSFSSSFSSVTSSMWVTALGLALPLSAMNAFNEELVTRWTIVEGLKGTQYFSFAPIISALIFGIAHYFGTPGGFIGVLMAGFLGWLLTKSLQGTGGLGWAWIIHFIQDVIILTVLISISL